MSAMLRLIVTVGCLLGVQAATAGDDDLARDRPLSPAEALAAFHVAADLRIELLAAEPLVESPVAAAFLSPARLLVVENRGYPTGPSPGQQPQGRISLLTDSDGDGRFDRRATFADELTFPNGVLPYRDGAIVTCAPDVLFLADRDGDGRAEFRQSLLTGFSTTGSTQLRVSHPLLGHDGWVYVCGGLTGGTIRRPDEPEDTALTVGRADVRFREVDGIVRYEKVDGGGQFGQSFDDFGRRFICYNRVQVQHVVLTSEILQRNKYLAFAETVQNCPAEMVAEPLAGHGAAARIFPISQNVTTADSHAGTFTAACGVTVFRGRGLGPGYRGVAFSCDPTANLVHADRLTPHGATFLAQPLIDGAEVLASQDNWFRPVNLFHGPDGALYVCDMYRRTIEHPDYLPEEIRKRTDFESGKSLGRIWRIAARKIPSTPTPHWSDEPSVEQLVSWLRDGDGWWQDEAARRLSEKRDSKATPLLAGLAADSKAPVEAASRALWLLEQAGELKRPMIQTALADERSRVRESALAVCDERRAASIGLDVLKCAVDDDPRVRFSAAIAVHRARLLGDHATKALCEIAVRSADDRWTRAAVLSSIQGREREFGEALMAEFNEPGPLDERATAAPGIGDLFYEFGATLGPSLAESGTFVYRPRKTQSEFSERIGASGAMIVKTPGLRPAIRNIVGAAFMTGISDSERARSGASMMHNVLGAEYEDPDPVLEVTYPLVDWAHAVAPDPAAPLHQRLRAIRFLSHLTFERTGAKLIELLDLSAPPEIQLAAVEALALLRDVRVAETLLASDRFGALSPAVQQRAVQALLADPLYVPAVLNAIARGTVQAGVIDPVRRQQLARHSDPKIAERAEKLFASAGGPERQQVFDQWKDVVDLPATAASGQAVFRRLCTQCHRLDREGVAVGPDLFGIRNQPKAAILLHILIPEREITPGFAAYAAELKDGRTLTGLLAAEATGSVTLRQPQGKEEVIRRDDIERLEASRLSLMPQDFERQISRQEMADLLVYLKGQR